MNSRLNNRAAWQLLALTLIAAVGLMVLSCAQPGEAPEAAAKTEVAAKKVEAAPKAVAPEKAPLAAAEAKPAPPAFGEIDKDGDGFLSKEELHGFLFARMDADADGKITTEEHQAHRAGRHHGHGKAHGGCPHAAKEAAGKAGCDCPDCKDCAGKGECTCPKCEDCPHCQNKAKGEGGCGCGGHSFATCDANGDGAVTIDECKKGERVLVKLDTDKDGKVSKEEYDAHHKPQGHGHGHGHAHGHGHGHGHGHAH